MADLPDPAVVFLVVLAMLLVNLVVILFDWGLVQTRMRLFKEEVAKEDGKSSQILQRNLEQLQVLYDDIAQERVRTYNALGIKSHKEIAGDQRRTRGTH